MEMVLTLFGGLALFLFGMNFMSQGLQKAAGDRLRGVLTAISKKRIIGVLFGALFTAIIQSSGATTVMVVTFVDGGMMSLAQSVGIIFGANIGTTITAQLVSFKLTGIAPVILLIGVIVFLFFKKPLMKKVGEIILGFGALFLGISMMSDSMAQLADIDGVKNTLASLTNPFLAILVALLITIVVQSSSVTVSIFLLMAGQGLIGLDTCFFAILGCNIGSCTPAVMAAFRAKKDAKRAALIHVLFNVVGLIVIGIFLAFAKGPFEEFIMSISGGDLKRAVANTDTIYKVFQTILLYPFAGGLVALSKKLIPGDDHLDEGYKLAHISDTTTVSPAAVLAEAESEIIRMGHMASENLKAAYEGFVNQDKDAVEAVYKKEKYIDYLSHEITDFLVESNRMQLPVSDSKKIGGLFHAVNDIEGIGDHAENIADATLRCIDDGLEFSKKALAGLTNMYDEAARGLEIALEMIEHTDRDKLKEMIIIEDVVDEMEIDLQNDHIKRMAKGKCTPEAGLVYSDIVTGLERVSDHAMNVAFALYEGEEIHVSKEFKQEVLKDRKKDLKID